MDWHDRTIKTYDESADKLAKHFAGIGARTEDIERALKLANKADKTARVVEIGCGDGRDAAEICNRVGWYQGFDPSEGLLKIARKRLPDSSFVEADALSYTYPTHLDVIYAFASLLHVNDNELEQVLRLAARALNEGGIILISLKERSAYAAEVRKDEFGERMFYYYNAPHIKQLAGNAFATAYENHYTIGHTEWFTLALQKR